MNTRVVALVSVQGVESERTNNPFLERIQDKLYEYFRQQALLLKTDEPEVMAEQLLLLYDGCSSWIVMHREFPRSTFRTLDLIIN